MKNPTLLCKIAPKVGNKLRKELISTASPSSGSCFSVNDLQSLSSFQWSILTQDLKRTALLCAILEKCVNANRCDVRKPNKDAVVAVVENILFRNCSTHIFSAFLCKSYNCLQKLFLCLSHKQTISVVEELGKSQITAAGSHITSTSSQITATGSHITSTSSQVTATGSHITSTSSQVTATGSHITSTSSQITATGSHITSTSSQVTATGSHITSTSS